MALRRKIIRISRDAAAAMSPAAIGLREAVSFTPGVDPLDLGQNLVRKARRSLQGGSDPKAESRRPQEPVRA